MLYAKKANRYPKCKSAPAKANVINPPCDTSLFPIRNGATVRVCLLSLAFIQKSRILGLTTSVSCPSARHSSYCIPFLNQWLFHLLTVLSILETLLSNSSILPSMFYQWPSFKYFLQNVPHICALFILYIAACPRDFPGKSLYTILSILITVPFLSTCPLTHF